MGIDLVTLAEYKAYTGKTSTTDDAAITAIIPKASALVKSVCRRTFVDYVNDAKVELVNIVFQGMILLDEPNILTVSSVEFSDDYGATYTGLVEFVDYVINIKNDNLFLLNTKTDYYKPNAYKVTYTAGTEVIPEDLKIATLDLVTYYLRNEAAIHSNKGIGSNTVQIEYITGTKLPSHISRVLDIYVANYS